MLFVLSPPLPNGVGFGRLTFTCHKRDALPSKLDSAEYIQVILIKIYSRRCLIGVESKNTTIGPLWQAFLQEPHCFNSMCRVPGIGILLCAPDLWAGIRPSQCGLCILSTIMRKINSTFL